MNITRMFLLMVVLPFVVTACDGKSSISIQEKSCNNLIEIANNEEKISFLREWISNKRENTTVCRVV